MSSLGTDWVKQGLLSSTVGYFLYDLAFVASCLASLCACLAFFRQVMNQTSLAWTHLSDNAYGIYLVHYPFVTWLQFALLGVNVPVVVKFFVVFLGALSLSWFASSLMRKNAVATQIV